MSTIALTCPSSFTTWTLARLLLRRGDGVRLLCRSCQRVDPLLQQGAQIVSGNLLDPSAVRELLHGASILYLVTPGSGVPDDDYEVRIARVAVQAIGDSSIEHIVYLSALGADRPGKVAHLQAKSEIEQILLDTGRDVTLLRPAVLMDNIWLARRALDRGILALPMHPDSAFPAIAARDVALTALQVVTHGSTGCRSYDLPGSQEVTPRRMAEQLEQAWGRSIHYYRYSADEFQAHLQALGLTQRRARLLTRILVDYDTYQIRCDRRAWARLRMELGLLETTSIERFAAQLAEPRAMPESVQQAISHGGPPRRPAASLERGMPEAWLPGNHVW